MNTYPKLSDALVLFKHLFTVKLTGQENFQLWKADVSLFLEAVNVSKDRPVKENSDIPNYICKLIIKSISEELQYDYALYDNLYDLLEALDNRFNKPFLSQIISLKRKLYSQSFSTVQELLTDTNKIILQLRKLNQFIPDSEIAHIILASLSPSFESFISSLEINASLKQIQQRLLHISNLNDAYEDSTMLVRKDFYKKPYAYYLSDIDDFLL
ncbi:Hypothetical protein SRAE_0000062700 [Strongyloides ratti]|uniref:Retrovirus-related Pol polyprotein from transposon TNT 1-94 n=1 Tax=Strongyloides ratti TaxID=34506 RepID=A0A090KVG0_STRRB|nr:Hypothetical protein SRAE_0000062700 [Strongyloides ratti]CEF61505.1 Hypothetical protein SRAE_0000062700 [Strongyloides ratti]